METNEQGLTKEERLMFSILGIILLVAVGVLIIGNTTSKDRELEDNKTPMTNTSEKKEEVKDDNNNEPVDILIEEETEEEDSYYPVVTIPSSPGTNNEEEPIIAPVVRPIELDWTFKNTMVTEAYSGDTIYIEKNVLLLNGVEQEAIISVLKYEQETWIEVDITSLSFNVTEGYYKYIYSCGSYTKELLLTVKPRFAYTEITLLKLNELLTENSTINIEEFTKYQEILNNTLYEHLEGINTLTINNYVNTNNLLPIVVTTNMDLTNKALTTTKEGITISLVNNDWHEQITPNSMILWLDLNTIDVTNNIIDINIDGVIYNLELNIIINNYVELPENPDQSELEKDETGNEEENNNASENNPEDNPSEEETSSDGEENENNSKEEEEDELDPLEPTEESDSENSSNNTDPSEQEQNEVPTLQPGNYTLSVYSP